MSDWTRGANDDYAAKGDAWADFLHHRRRVIVAMIEEGQPPEKVARTLSMDPGQVRLIYAGRKEPG